MDITGDLSNIEVNSMKSKCRVLVFLLLLSTGVYWTYAAKVTVGGHAQVDISLDFSDKDMIKTHADNIRDRNRGRLNITPAEKLGCGMTAIAKFEYPHLVKPKTPAKVSPEFSNPEFTKNARAAVTSVYKLMVYEASGCG